MGQLFALVYAIILCIVGATEAMMLDSNRILKDAREDDNGSLVLLTIPPGGIHNVTIIPPMDGSLIQPVNLSVIPPQDVVQFQPQEDLLVQPQEGIMIEPKDGVLVQPQDGLLEQSQEGITIQPKDGLLVQPQKDIMSQPQDVLLVQSQEGIMVQPQEDLMVQPQDGLLVQPVNDPQIVPSERQASALNCGSYTLLTGVTYAIQSRNYPKSYPINHNCIWKFTATGAASISVTCSPFSVYRMDNLCTASYLQLTGGNLNTRYCGTFSTPFTAVSYANYLTATFQTNTKVATGFKCLVTPIAATTTTTAPPSTCRSCGTVNRASRIVGGVQTEVNEYPWQVALVSAGTNSVFCGGTVYNNFFIMTAAHCVDAIIKYAISPEALLGAHNVNSPTTVQQRIAVVQWIKHPNYNNSNFDNDIGLLKLDSAAALSDKVKPACLPNPSASYDNVMAIATGWGNLVEGGSGPSTLMEVELPTMSNAQCQQYYGPIITGNMICAGYAAGGKSTCQGDSGGALVTNVNGVWVQIGVTSWAYGCARPKLPTAFVRVSKYLTWLATTASAGTNNLCSGVISCRCGKVNRARIVGGTSAQVHEYPWQVALVPSNGIQPFCGGSIISNQWILTAAHCVYDLRYVTDISVIIGEHNWGTTSDTVATKRKTVAGIYYHGSFSSDTLDNDIALIQLNAPITFSTDNKISPICLPPAGSLYENVQAVATGWGRLYEEGPFPYPLQEVTVPTMSNAQCSSYLDFITNNMICAGLAVGGKDICRGDSGGPLITSGNNAQTYMIQIGISSFGMCGIPNFPGGYARVNRYLTWITSVTGPLTTCPPA